ncbi:energy transducer TonB [Vibrio sp. D404a]|uniref:energy transducer TonB n=1 Tax=unclassified Vibrio TaxID=2614977 RepID=UPI00255729B0|nr:MULTISPECIES: energy transducer TonB [unclassified Vibrio]MDK9736440.1 energy transducer TonB [Vibrio sp. D404a]MDK9796062.1 energy transducer TonB [Vibrio sp. D449a]
MKKAISLILAIMVVGCTSTSNDENTYTIDQQEYGARLATKVYYPEEARKLNLEGTAMIQADIAQDGNVIGITIIESSGHNILDTAATRTLLATKFPRHRAPHPITVVMPIVYKLENQ